MLCAQMSSNFLMGAFRSCGTIRNFYPPLQRSNIVAATILWQQGESYGVRNPPGDNRADEASPMAR